MGNVIWKFLCSQLLWKQAKKCEDELIIRIINEPEKLINEPEKSSDRTIYYLII